MSESLWQKIRENRFLLMVLCCLIPITIIGVLSWVNRGNYWVWLIILLCPLMHIWMMGHKHNEFCSHQDKLYQCFKCGLKYKEKEWAEKCEKWCRKNESCNLEITKHAIQRSSKK